MTDWHFNSHAHVERDLTTISLSADSLISTHTLTWSVTIVHKLKITVENNFNSHAHVERDRDVDMFQKCICYFNSHAHVERDSSPIVNAYGVVYFNSHAHVERDALLKFSLCQIIGISTHTLTWSVTREISVQFFWTYISTHTLTWSVTYAYILSYKATSISTHTLTWSVTIQLFIYVFLAKFQLTRSRGA